MFPKALILYLWYVQRKAQRLSLLLYLPANSSLPECDCSFLYMFHQTAEMVLREKINKKEYFYCDFEALKVFRKYRCHHIVRATGQWWANLDQASKHLEVFRFRDLSPTPIP
jgi:hypothetical protein